MASLLSSALYVIDLVFLLVVGVFWRRDGIPLRGSIVIALLVVLGHVLYPPNRQDYQLYVSFPMFPWQENSYARLQCHIILTRLVVKELS